jgi:hypothetical protein
MSPHRAQLPGVRVVGDNQFARAARAEKVFRLVCFIDAYAIGKGVDPLRRPDLVLDALSKMTPAGWAKTAAKAHVNAPSDESIAAVRKVYADRLVSVRRAS